MQIMESVESTPDLEAREERRCSGRRALVGHGLDMEDLASMCERQCRKACNLRSAAEELEETGSNGRARRYRKRGSPKPAAEARAMETDPSPVRLRWNRLEPRFNKNRKEPRRFGNPPLSFREYRSQHDGCWVCYGKGNNHAHDHRHCKVYEDDKKTYFAAHPDKKPKEQRIADWKAKGGDGGKGQGKGQGKGGGKGYGGGRGPDRRVRSIEEVAEDMLRTLEELKAQQRGGQSLGGSQQEGAAAGHV